MKKLSIMAFIMLLNLQLHAQTGSNLTSNTLDYQLRDVDITKATSGIIYERTPPIANLYNYNAPANYNTADYSFFRQSLLEMHRASNNNLFISLDSLKTQVRLVAAKNTAYIGVLNTQFNVLNYNEENPSKGGMTMDTINNKFVQIPNTDPFYLMHNTVITPLKDAISGDRALFRFSADFFFTNGDKTIYNLSADFGNGVIATIIDAGVFIEQEVSVYYETNGEKAINFTVTFNDGQVLKTNGAVYFVNTSLSASAFASCSTTDVLREDFNLVPAAESFTGYRTTDPQIKPKVSYRIYYADNNSAKKIKKPIIILDGFDPGDVRRIEDCDCEQDPVCANKYKDNHGDFSPIKHISIVDKMIYYKDGAEKPLLIELRAKGYDVIIVNFPTYSTTNLLTGQDVVIDGGAYYMESNAMSIITLLKGVKSKLVVNGSTNQIALIAPSMGGQISRYALSYMEKKFQETNNNEWQHNVHLWVSIDSPHLGANIPLGVQALLSLASDVSDAAEDFYKNQLSSPAAQQQLIEFHRKNPTPSPFNPSALIHDYHVADPAFLNAQTASQGMNATLGNAFFKKHYNDQNLNGTTGSNGWPINLRKIAIVNGSLTGSKKATNLDGSPSDYDFANANEKVLNLRGFQRIHVNLLIGSLTWYVHIASLESQFMSSTGSTARVARFKKLWDDKTTIATNLNSRGVMDNVPGGYFNAQGIVAGSTQQTNPVPGSSAFASFNSFSINNLIFELSEHLGGSRWFLHEFNPIHSFIPSFSAIAHLQPNQSWSTPLNTNLLCSSNRKTPFDSYFGTANNTEHTSFTYECVTWLLKELEGIPQSPSYPLDNITLNGPSKICLNTNTIYSFDEICRIPSAVASWSTSSNLLVLNQNSISITVKAIASGNGYITATFDNGQTITKSIYLGFAKFNSITTINTTEIPQLSPLPSNSCGTLGFEVNFMPSNDDVLEYEWQKTTQDVAWQRDYLTDASNRVFLYPSCNKTFVFQVRVRNSCGWSEWFSLTYDITSCSQNCVAQFNGIIGTNFIMNPNPVNNGILNSSVKAGAPWFTTLNPGNPAILDPNQQVGSNGTTTNFSPNVNITIFNQSGALLQTYSSIALPTALNIGNLPQGVYLVIMRYMNQAENYTIIKN